MELEEALMKYGRWLKFLRDEKIPDLEAQVAKFEKEKQKKAAASAGDPAGQGRSPTFMELAFGKNKAAAPGAAPQGTVDDAAVEPMFDAASPLPGQKQGLAADLIGDEDFADSADTPDVTDQADSADVPDVTEQEQVEEAPQPRKPVPAPAPDEDDDGMVSL